MRQGHLFLIILHLFLSGVLAAQENKLQLLFRNINEKEGLSNNIVNSIALDKQGYMWIGTFDGLNRYDGSHFVSFRNNRNQSTSLDQNTVHDICIDRNDDIWCATQTSISCFRKKTQTFETFSPDDKNQGATYSDILCDSSGNIWCAGNFGIYKLSPGEKKFVSYSNGTGDRQLTSPSVYKRGLALSPDQKSLWIATTKGLNCLDLSTNVIYNYNNNPSRLAVFDSAIHYPVTFDLDGKLVYGSEVPGEVRQYDFASNRVTVLDILFSKRKNTASAPSCIFIDKDNRYWISTWAYTSFVYDPRTKEAQEFYHDKKYSYSISGDFFWDALQDQEGTIWFGTVNGLSVANNDIGVYRIYEPVKYASDEKQQNPINRYVETANGSWWFTTTGNTTLNSFHPSTGKFKSYTLPANQLPIRGITNFNGYLLLNGNKGFFSFDTARRMLAEIPALSSLKKITGSQAVYWIRIVNDSVLCLLAEETGLIQFNYHTGITRTISLENDFLKRNISRSRSCIVSSAGDLYLAFTPLTLAKFNVKEHRLDSLPIGINEKMKLLEGPALNLKEDQNGNLWFALKGAGLVFYNVTNQQSKLWQQSDGLVFNHIFDLAFDKRGKIWLAAYNKFSVFDPAKGRFENFTLPLSENNYEYSSRLLTLENGNILANIDKTFIEWLPAKFGINNSRHTVLINKLTLRDSVVLLGRNSSITLNHKDNNITIEFGLLSALERNNYTLQYKLDGFDQEWISATTINTAVYNNLPEKKFVFRVRAASIDGSWVGKESTLDIRIIPPFYRTTWFRILMAILLGMIVAGVIRLRVNNVRNSEKQKNEFNKMISGWKLKALRAQMNPHFIFNCLNSIDLYILKNDAENASRYLNKFAKLVRLILSQSNEMFVPLRKEVEMLKYYIELEELRFDHPFTHKIIVDDRIDPDETEVPSMLLQPYVENAILHGLRHKEGKGHLLVSIRRSAEGLSCIVEDNGVGRKRANEINSTRAQQHDSRGSFLTAERLAMLNAGAGKPVVTITDLEDAMGHALGTRVEITIPFEFDY